MIGNWFRSIRKARAKRRANVVAASSVALQVIYLYAGQPKNFEKWFGDRIEDDDLRELLSHIYERFFAYGAFFVVPAAIVKVVLGESLSSYGLRVGKWWKGLPILAVGLPAATASAWYAAGKKEFQDEYPLSETARRGGRDLLYYEIANFHYYIGWEFFYRGYLQHGLEEAYGVEGATAFQTVASTLMHIGKPFDETAGAGFAGPLFGWMARTTDSVYYPLIAHWWLGLATDIFCLLRAPEESPVPQAQRPRPAMALPLAKRVPPLRAQSRKKKKAVSKAAK